MNDVRLAAPSVDMTCTVPDYDVDEFLNATFDELVDALLAIDVNPTADFDVWLVRSAGEDHVWFAAISRRSEHRSYHLQAGRGCRLETMGVEYALSGGGDQARSLADAWQAFRSWLPFEPRAVDGDPKRKLVVKVDPHERWFLRFPVSLFCDERLFPLERYVSVSWIVTQRSITEWSIASSEVAAAAADLRSFLSGTTIIINTYSRHFTNAPELQQATDAVVELLTLLADVSINGTRAALRWFVNPGPAELLEVLSDSTVHFFYADFESDLGAWELGDGPCRSWRASTRSAGDAPPPSSSRVFAGSQLPDDLHHLWLARVFHCNSVYDPGLFWDAARQPADADTVVGHLLARGALFVEGSMSAESYRSYLVTICQLLLARPDVRLVLGLRSYESGVDLVELLSRLSKSLGTNISDIE
jgi:hypothetical protein